MEEHKKKVLILVGCLLILIAFIAVFLGMIFKDSDDKKPVDPNNNSNTISKEIVRLDNSEEFFGIQRALNDYYLMLANNNREVINLLDKDFINEKNINTNNIFDVIKSDYENTSFIVKEIYYNPNSSITYYFVNGYLIDRRFMDDDYYYEESVNYLIIKNSVNNYVIRVLDNNSNISDIAHNFQIKEVTIQNNYLLSFNRIREENKLTTYINEFMNLLDVDNKRAYELLDEDTKKKYINYDDFSSKDIDIYNMLSSKIFSYASKDNENYKIYNIIDDKQNNIRILENNIMDYKIGY